MARPLFSVDTSELRKALDEAGEEVSKRLGAANRAAAQVVVDEALPRVPVRSGRLRGSVKALGSQKGGEAKAGGARVPYAALIHWGSKRRNVKSRPFLTNAATASQSRVRAVYEKAITEIVSKL